MYTRRHADYPAIAEGKQLRASKKGEKVQRKERRKEQSACGKRQKRYQISEYKEQEERVSAACKVPSLIPLSMKSLAICYAMPCHAFTRPSLETRPNQTEGVRGKNLNP